MRAVSSHRTPRYCARVMDGLTDGWWDGWGGRAVQGRRVKPRRMRAVCRLRWEATPCQASHRTPQRKRKRNKTDTPWFRRRFAAAPGRRPPAKVLGPDFGCPSRKPDSGTGAANQAAPHESGVPPRWKATSGYAAPPHPKMLRTERKRHLRSRHQTTVVHLPASLWHGSCCACGLTCAFARARL